MTDPQIKVPHGTTGLQWATLARNVEPDAVRLFEEVCLYEVRAADVGPEPTTATAPGLSHPVPDHDGRFCVWMQHPIVINNKRPWGRIADGLTAEHVAVFVADPAQRLSIQRSRLVVIP